MPDSMESNADFLADAEHHNTWWSDGEAQSAVLDDVSSLAPRSDLLKCLEEVDGKRNEVDSMVYPMYGPTGIGKTTLLLQFVAAVLPQDIVDFDPGNRDLDIVGAVDPRKVLYVPLEESLYHLEQSEDAIAQLGHVVDYFYSHVAPRNRRKYVLLDDVGALRLSGEEKGQLLELIDDQTYLIHTGTVESEVDLSEVGQDSSVDIHFTWSMLPMKFIDTVQQRTYDETIFTDLDTDLAATVESQRTKSIEGPNRIKDVRDNLSSRDELPDAVDGLQQLYFDVFSRQERNALHDAARAYLQKGGLFQRAKEDTVNNELVRSHFLLYLYKELAQYQSIQQPENLHRVASIAASQAGEELNIQDVSERLGVDRRTFDTYLSLLDEGLSVSESHDFSLERHRRTRLYLRNPRHVVLLSQRQEHFGFESYEPTGTLNHEFEYKLARTVAFDHAKRISYRVANGGDEDPAVEYVETEAGTVDYILHNDDGLVVPFVLSYHPNTGNAADIAAAFDPSVGKHKADDELQDLEYEAPYRFVVTDSLPSLVLERESLVVERDGQTICYVPFWLFLLVC